MMKKGVVALCLFMIACGQGEGSAEGYPFGVESADELSEVMPGLAEQLIEESATSEADYDLETMFQLQVIAGHHEDALETLKDLRAARVAETADVADVPYLRNPAELAHLESELYLRAKRHAAEKGVDFEAAFAEFFRERFSELSNRQAHRFFPRVEYLVDMGETRLEAMLGRFGDTAHINRAQALQLARLYRRHHVKTQIISLLRDLVDEDAAERFEIEEGVLIETEDGATLHATVVRPKGVSQPLPTAFSFNVYATRVNDLLLAKLAAVHGYAGVVANTRGKRVGTDPVEPYRHEPVDTHAVLDWIVEQDWSNGDVGIWGGSYSGYAAWAAMKNVHPAVRTMAPMAAAIPGLGWPMHNNVFLNANYCWTYHVTNNKTLDYEPCGDWQRWQTMQSTYYESGRPYREIDEIDGTPNPLLQEWLDHPAYDSYWQRLVPYGKEFAEIDVPVLTITGYYDEGQVSALHYLNQHYRHNPDAEHYLVITPADHPGAQWGSEPSLRRYTLDPVARISPPDLVFQWFDYVMRGGDKPELLQDRINYQVMGANRWRHAPSMDALSDDTIRLYLTDAPSDDQYTLSANRPPDPGSMAQEIDFRDRETTSVNYYPWPIVGDPPDTKDALVFVSEPFEEPVEVSGAFSGELKATINKKDLDPVLILFERKPDGQYFRLSYYLGRASYAHDMTERQLLQPGKMESIPVRRSYMTAKRLEEGSQLIAVLDVNRIPGAQINYGTGGDVSEESIEDAKEPLRVQWHNQSYIEMAIRR